MFLDINYVAKIFFLDFYSLLDIMKTDLGGG